MKTSLFLSFTAKILKTKSTHTTEHASSVCQVCKQAMLNCEQFSFFFHFFLILHDRVFLSPIVKFFFQSFSENHKVKSEAVSSFKFSFYWINQIQPLINWNIFLNLTLKILQIILIILIKRKVNIFLAAE